MLHVQNLSKSFGKTPVLQELTFEIAAGGCLVLLGRNGTGKTLLLNILATLVAPTAGTVSIDGLDAFANLKAVRRRIGYLPAGFAGYPEMSVTGYLNFFAAAYRLPKSERTEAIAEVLTLMDIGHLQESAISVLSAGERQRLLFAKTFLHQPHLWLLDEPLTPLDPGGQVEMFALLGELRAMGSTLVIATNRPEDVRRLCEPDRSADTTVGILNDGRFAVFESFEALQERIRGGEEDAAEAPAWLNELLRRLVM